LGLAVGSIPLAFAALSAAAALASALVAGRLARDLQPELGPPVRWLAATLAIAHVSCIRSAAQLQMDPFCNLWTIACVALALRLRAGGGPAARVALGVLLVSAPLVKISLFPLLALPALAALLGPGEQRVRASITAGLVYGCLPLAVWLLVLLGIGALHAGFEDLRDQATQFTVDARYLLGFGLEMALLFQAFPLLLALRPPRRHELLVVLALALILLATWGFRFPAIPRLYLPLTSLFAVLAAPRLLALLPRRWPQVLALFLALNYGLGVAFLVYAAG
jgi:hypothetical protein